MSKKRRIVIIIFIFVFALCILFSHIYYNSKYSITFETGTTDEMITRYVKRYEKVTKPVDPIKEGYVFIEWQLNGKTFDFNTKISDDIVLTAKWEKEEYITIKFYTNTEDVIEDIKILKGGTINELPLLRKDGYNFLGWYINDEKYVDQTLYSSTIIEAKFELIEPEYNVGDKVLITGSYSNKSTSINSTINTYAIGWTREILYVLEGEDYPFVLGDSTGVTGFFKKESIKKVNY